MKIFSKKNLFTFRLNTTYVRISLKYLWYFLVELVWEIGFCKKLSISFIINTVFLLLFFLLPTFQQTSINLTPRQTAQLLRVYVCACVGVGYECVCVILVKFLFFHIQVVLLLLFCIFCQSEVQVSSSFKFQIGSS